MSSLQKEPKIYGAVESDSYVTFTGFCKKIYDTAQQSLDVYIDEKKIATLLANEKIADIENKYEVFDTNGFCFTYKLPQEYIGQKHKLEFKTKDGEQLLHSPIVTICPEHPFYNEWLFVENLNKSITTEKSQNVEGSKSIGFLLTDESQTDLKFLNFIKDLRNKFPNTIFRGFCFNELQKRTISTMGSNINISIVSTPQDCILSTDVLLYSSYFKEWKKLAKYILRNSLTVPISYDGEQRKIKLSTFTFENIEKFGFSKEEELLSGQNVFKLLYLNSFEKYSYIFDIEQNSTTELIFDSIKLAINYPEFKERLHKVTSYLCKDF
jgi:hypothetical protein